jgi:hypothetical protein
MINYTFSDLGACYFYVAQNTQYLNMSFCMFVMNRLVHADIFFPNLLKLKIDFHIFFYKKKH